MLVKTQHNLIPAEMQAHTVVIEDNLKNPIFVATHVAEGIIYPLSPTPILLLC